MPNPFFQFKQFTVYQDACAMKVCTDACLFGGWTVREVKSEQSTIKKILDIGTGTGLLSLMLAQATTADIDAVEIDTEASAQAAGNFASSPWSTRLQVHTQPVQQFAQTGNQYNLVVSNPPFFENDLKSNNSKRNLALHSEALSLEELFAAAGQLVQTEGHFAILLPYHRSATVKALAVAGNWHITAEALVKQTPLHAPFRIMLLLSRKSEVAPAATETIVIRDENGLYTPEFTTLLTSYYLYL